MDFKYKEWNQSYDNKENFNFYPHEEIIRFVSKYIKKRTGLQELTLVSSMEKGLDLGCGIGRHVIYLDDMGFDAYGIDLSEKAINTAKTWSKFEQKEHLLERFHLGSITEMPYKDDIFDFVVSHGVLDSMNYEIAKKAIKETHRVMKKNGLFYLDLISGDDYEHGREYDGEEIVNTGMEKGTIQSYFNWSKINDLLLERFKIIDAVLIGRESIIKKAKHARYHLVVQKI